MKDIFTERIVHRIVSCGIRGEKKSKDIELAQILHLSFVGNIIWGQRLKMSLRSPKC